MPNHEDENAETNNEDTWDNATTHFTLPPPGPAKT